MLTSESVFKPTDRADLDSREEQFRVQSEIAIVKYLVGSGKVDRDSDGRTVINACVYVDGRHLKSLDFLARAFGEDYSVSHDFDCSDNALTSLRGAPRSVGGYFFCYGNNLTSLDGGPVSVGGSYSCNNNQLTSLVGAPADVSGGYFDCDYNYLNTLQGCPKHVGGDFMLTVNMSQAEFTKDDIASVCDVDGEIITSEIMIRARRAGRSNLHLEESVFAPGDKDDLLGRIKKTDEDTFGRIGLTREDILGLRRGDVVAFTMNDDSRPTFHIAVVKNWYKPDKSPIGGRHAGRILRVADFHKPTDAYTYHNLIEYSEIGPYEPAQAIEWILGMEYGNDFIVKSVKIKHGHMLGISESVFSPLSDGDERAAAYTSISLGGLTMADLDSLRAGDLVVFKSGDMDMWHTYFLAMSDWFTSKFDGERRIRLIYWNWHIGSYVDDATAAVMSQGKSVLRKSAEDILLKGPNQYRTSTLRIRRRDIVDDISSLKLRLDMAGSIVRGFIPHERFDKMKREMSVIGESVFRPAEEEEAAARKSDMLGDTLSKMDISARDLDDLRAGDVMMMEIDRGPGKLVYRDFMVMIDDWTGYNAMGVSNIRYLSLNDKSSDEVGELDDPDRVKGVILQQLGWKFARIMSIPRFKDFGDRPDYLPWAEGLQERERYSGHGEPKIRVLKGLFSDEEVAGMKNRPEIPDVDVSGIEPVRESVFRPAGEGDIVDRELEMMKRADDARREIEAKYNGGRPLVGGQYIKVDSLSRKTFYKFDLMLDVDEWVLILKDVAQFDRDMGDTWKEVETSKRSEWTRPLAWFNMFDSHSGSGIHTHNVAISVIDSDRAEAEIADMRNTVRSGVSESVFQPDESAEARREEYIDKIKRREHEFELKYNGGRKLKPFNVIEHDTPSSDGGVVKTFYVVDTVMTFADAESEISMIRQDMYKKLKGTDKWIRNRWTTARVRREGYEFLETPGTAVRVYSPDDGYRRMSEIYKSSGGEVYESVFAPALSGDMAERKSIMAAEEYRFRKEESDRYMAALKLTPEMLNGLDAGDLLTFDIYYPSGLTLKRYMLMLTDWRLPGQAHDLIYYVETDERPGYATDDPNWDRTKDALEILMKKYREYIKGENNQYDFIFKDTVTSHIDCKRVGEYLFDTWAEEQYRRNGAAEVVSTRVDKNWIRSGGRSQ